MDRDSLSSQTHVETRSTATSETAHEPRKRSCSIHSQRQCCLANPQFQSYMATYSAGSSSNSNSISESCATAINTTDAVGENTQTTTSRASISSTTSTTNPNGQRTSNVANAQAHSVPVPAKPPLPATRNRRNTISSAIVDPPFPTSTSTIRSILTNPPASRSAQELASSTTATRRRTLDFIVDENAARRDLNAVNAKPKPMPTPTPRPRPRIQPQPQLPGPPAARHSSARLTRFTEITKSDSSSDSKSSLSTKIVTPTTAASKGSLVINAPNTYSKARSKSNAPHTPRLLPPPTNHVHLSRKTSTARTSLIHRLCSGGVTKRRQQEISDITGVFVIDPELVLPRGLFKAFDDSLVGPDSGHDALGLASDVNVDEEGMAAIGRRPAYSGAGNTGSEMRMSAAFPGGIGGKREKNLKLEVENGGIDVDIHLVPITSLGEKRKGNRTTIELALVSTPGKPTNHPLSARIHAPKPRLPIHLTARTYTPPAPPAPPASPPLPSIPSSPITSPAASPTPRPRTAPATLKKPQTHIVRFDNSSPPIPSAFFSASTPSLYTPTILSASPAPDPVPATSVLDKSNLQLHIPRSFHGPITIHVAAGNLDAHISFSNAVKERCVVLREGSCARGVFVGAGLGFDFGGKSKGTEVKQKCERCEGGRDSGSSMGDGDEVERRGGIQERRSSNDPNGRNSGDGSLHAGTSPPQTPTVPNRRPSTAPTPSTQTQTQKIKRKPVKFSFDSTTSLDATLLQPSSPTNTDRPTSAEIFPTGVRPSFLDVDPDTLSKKVPSAHKPTAHKAQNVNGRVRVSSEHQPVSSSPLRLHSSSTSPSPPPSPTPLPPLTTSSTLVTSPLSSPVLSSPSTLQGDPARVQDSVETEEGVEGGTTGHVKRISVEKKVFSNVRGWHGPTSSSDDSDEHLNDSNVVSRTAAVVGTARVGVGKAGGCVCGNGTGNRIGNEARSGEWIGDRIDISIGRGRVRIQFEDEEEGESEGKAREGRRWARRWFRRGGV